MIKIKNILLSILTLLIVACSSSIVDYDKVIDDSVNKIAEAEKSLACDTLYPRFIDHGHTDWELVGIRDWTSGFWGGALWYAYELSGNQDLLSAAHRFSVSLKEIAYTPAIDHDIGFQMYCSLGNGYRLTGKQEYKELLLASADTLATLYNPIVGSIHSWPFKPQYPHNTIIDNMMNLELLFWAAKNGGDAHLAEIAESHAEVTMKHIVRPDYSAYHLGCFDNKTGEFMRGVAHQGYADNSMWARGQTWGIYGFAIAYRETGRTDFLTTSMCMADKFLERLPEDGIPYWDFDDLKIPNTPKDASAAAVAACGMLELSAFVKDAKDKARYVKAAKAMMDILSSDQYLCGDENQAILKHSVGHMPKNSEIDVPIIYGDYYYLEALVRLQRMNLITH